MFILDPIHWPAPSWLVSSIGRALHWYHRGHGFKSRTGLNFFQVLFTTTRFSSVLSCEDLLISRNYILVTYESERFNQILSKKAKHEPDYFAPALVVLALHHQHTQGAQIFFFPGHCNPLTESQNWVLVSLLGFWDWASLEDWEVGRQCLPGHCSYCHQQHPLQPQFQMLMTSH